MEENFAVRKATHNDIYQIAFINAELGKRLIEVLLLQVSLIRLVRNNNFQEQNDWLKVKTLFVWSLTKKNLNR